MRTVQIGKCEVKMYEDIDEMPIKVYNLLNEYSLKDYEIGSDMAAVNRHFEKLDLFLSKNKITEAIQERKNMQQTYWNILNRVNFSSLQFACMIYSVNGNKVEDYSEASLLELLDELSDEGLTQGLATSIVNDSKKKVLAQLRLCFPEKFSDAFNINYYAQLVNKLKAQLKNIIDERLEYVKAIELADEYLTNLIKPRFLDPNSSRNEVVRQKVDFESLCVVLMKNGIQDPDKMTVFRFYSTISVFEKEKK